MQSMGPNYLSARSSEVILSDIRPTKIKPETLRSINVLLDELLLLVLSTARSVSTERLKGGLLKVLPTSLGKEAILEAEIELRAYHERTAPSDPALAAEPTSIKDFPLQPVVELLRMKCEAYSTLSDFDGDAELEAHLQVRIASTGGSAAPRQQAIAPAALYLTAVLEHICEYDKLLLFVFLLANPPARHVLSNLARVVARDSSRTAAHVQDLHVALCEDESIYGLYKNMKVQQEIVAQVQEQQQPRARRSRSFSQDAGSPATASPINGGSSFSVDRSSTAVEPSEDSALGHSHRQSLDRGKPLNKMFKASNGSDHGHGLPTSKHQRSESGMSDRFRRSGDVHSPTPDSAEDEEFDNLMRSGATMKLTLTPDRLQTFEVAKEKSQRKGSTRSASSSALPSPGPVPPKSPSRRVVTSPSGLREVDSIEEGREDDMPTNGVVRSISKSVRSPPDLPPIPTNPSQPIPSARSRAISTTEQPSAKIINTSTILRKPSLSASLAAPSAFREPSPGLNVAPRGVPMPKSMDMGESGFPKRNRHVKRDSFDDDLSDEEVPVRRKPTNALAPKGNGSSSAATRELIDFLSEGPPEMIASPDSPKPKSGGRLRTMVSRLARASTERLRDAPPPPAKPMPPMVRPSASASLNALQNRAAYSPPAAPYYPRPSSPHSNSSSSHDADSPDTMASHRKLGQAAQWEATRVPSLATPNPRVPPGTNSIHIGHREATIVKGLPSPTADAERIEVSSTPRSFPTKSMQANNTAPRRTDVSNVTVTAEHAMDLRESILKATSPYECRLLVDMFLAKCGFGPQTLSTVPEVPVMADDSKRHEHSLVEALLGDGPSGFSSQCAEETLFKHSEVETTT